MKRRQITAVLALVLCTACAGQTPAAVLSPTAGSLSASADAVIVVALAGVQSAAVAFAPVDGFSAADTALVVKVVGDATKIIQAAQTGWVSALDEAFSVLQPELSPSAAATLDPWINAVQSAIDAAYATGLS